MAYWRKTAGRVVTDSEGAVGGVSVTVKQAGTDTLCTLKDNKAGTEALANPFETDAYGIWSFFTDVDLLSSVDFEVDVVFFKSGLDFSEMNEMYENYSLLGAVAENDAVLESDFDATTFLYALADNTPLPKTPAEVMTILGAAASGVNADITGLTALATQAAVQVNPFGVAAGNTGEIRLLELAAGGVHYTGFKAPDALAGNVIYVMPTADSTGTQYLVSDGSRVLSWATPGGGGDLKADGSVPLTSNWDVGAYTITALTFTSDQATGTAPFTVASTTVVANLNASFLEGNAASAFQAADAELSALAGLTFADQKMIVGNGAGTVTTANCTTFAQTILDDADQATVQGTLGVVPGTDVLVEQTIGISDNNLVEVDATSNAPVSTDYAAWTASGLEGRDKTQMLAFLNVADGADVTGSNAPQAHKDLHDPQDGGDALDTAAAAEVSAVVAAGVGTAHTFSRADHIHAINHAITDNHLLTVDDASAADDDFCRFTGNGIEGLTVAETITALLAADLPENVSIRLDPVLSVDTKWSGITEDGVAGTTALVYGYCYYLAASGKWELAKADAAATSINKLGMCVIAANTDATGTLLLYGKIRADGEFPTFTVGAPVHISAATAGILASAAPTGTTDFVVRIVGQATTGDSLFFAPDAAYATLV